MKGEAVEIFSTCAGCNETMRVCHDFQTHHSACEHIKDPNVINHYIRDMLTAIRNADWTAFNRAAATIEAADEAPPRLLDAAVIYAGWGWAVFPCLPGGKAPATRNGFKDATTNTGQIRKWWTENPSYNIGLATGHSFDVVDVDVPEGLFHWAEMREDNTIPEAHGIAVTPSSGQHILVKPTGGGNMTGWRPGIDYRGRGGYIVAAPSEVGGSRYRWTTYPSPEIKRS